jgi:hypothetical protein
MVSSLELSDTLSSNTLFLEVLVVELNALWLLGKYSTTCTCHKPLNPPLTFKQAWTGKGGITSLNSVLSSSPGL